MADIRIRNLDDEVKVRLVKEARNHGLSLNKYVCSILSDHAYNPALRSVEEKYSNLAKDMVSLYEQTLRRTDELIAENTHILKLISLKEDEV